MSARRVLIVDDETDIVDALSYALECRGFRVDVAYDGVAGLAAAKVDPPDLLILDVMLPGCNGYEVSRQLKDWMGAAPESRPFPILLLTARKVATPEREEFVSTWSRADGVLYKPFELDELLDRIDATMGTEPVAV